MQIELGLKRSLSEARLSGYMTNFAKMKCSDPIQLYIWNMCLAEALYPLLQTVEVGLRNAINEVVAEHYQDPYWILGVKILDPNHVIDVQRHKVKLSMDGRHPPIGKIIADLNFGFWTGLLDTSYEQKIWRRGNILKNAFPNMARDMRTRKNISRAFSKIRRLRNRIFHYEPIWHWQDLLRQHDLIIEAINWMEPKLLRLIDAGRFKDIYSWGPNGKK